MDVSIVKNSGESVQLGDHGVIVKDVLVGSIPIDARYGKAEGTDGNVDYGATAESRTITIPITIKANDLLDFPLLRDAIFALMVSKESFYINEMRRPKKLAYKFVDINEPPKMDESSDNVSVTGKRYLVRISNQFDFDQLNVYGGAELQFETTELPFAESIGTSQDIQEHGINVNPDLWGYGMGLITDPDSLIYTHTGTSFRVYNAGNVAIHPFEHDLKITISDVEDSTDHLEIENTTNGTTFKVNEGVSSSDKIIVDGANITSNGLQYLRKTNKQFIDLDVGWNDFTVKGASNIKIEFDMRFYYL